MYLKLCTFVILCFIFVSFSAQGQDAKKNKTPADRIDISKITSATITGKVASEPTEKSIIIQIQNPKANINLPANKGKNAPPVNDWKELEVPIKENTKFRFKEPIDAFDDKGISRSTPQKTSKNSKAVTLIFQDMKQNLKTLFPGT